MYRCWLVPIPVDERHISQPLNELRDPRNLTSNVPSNLEFKISNIGHDFETKIILSTMTLMKITARPERAIKTRGSGVRCSKPHSVNFFRSKDPQMRPACFSPYIYFFI